MKGVIEKFGVHAYNIIILDIGFGLVILILQGQHKPTEREFNGDALRTWLSRTQECQYVLKHLLLLEDLWLNAPTSGMPYLQHLGLDGGQEGN